jgi:hypothetical protein
VWLISLGFRIGNLTEGILFGERDYCCATVEIRLIAEAA